MKGAWPAALALLLGGCAVPPMFQAATLIADAFSYAVSGKSVTDHGISIVARKDCAMLRVVTGDGICREGESETMVADSAPAPTPEDGADGRADDSAVRSAVVAQIDSPAVAWPGRP